MIPKSFILKGTLWNFVKQDEEGWRYYNSKQTNFEIRCKGMKIEKIEVVV